MNENMNPHVEVLTISKYSPQRFPGKVNFSIGRFSHPGVEANKESVWDPISA